MKLIWCTSCNSIFSLRIGTVKTCDCGECKGQYIDNRIAEASGKHAVHIGMGTGALYQALERLVTFGPSELREFYIKKCPVITWLRPSTGFGNPHTREMRDE